MQTHTPAIRGGVQQIIKWQHNAIKIQGAIKVVKWAEGGLRGFGLLSGTQHWNPSGTRLHHSQSPGTAAQQHPLQLSSVIKRRI